MQLPPDTEIAGHKTVADWNNLKSDLVCFQDIHSWNVAYNEYYIARLDRYLVPIDSIKRNDKYVGEGFAIMTLICSLIEFLESTYLGVNYKYRRRGDPPLNQYEYDNSSCIFTSFLLYRAPFNSHFDKHHADEFYGSVRCGLLHEARTKGKWIIEGYSEANTLYENNDGYIILYRDNFLNATQDFINSYKDMLLTADERKKAFIRKFDNLCVE